LRTIPSTSGRSTRRVFVAGMAVALALASSACLHRHHAVRIPRQPPPPTTGPAPIVQGEVGIASWYGHPYDGRPTASGEIYNMYAMTAAHRTLPFGTRVRVHDLDNHRTVEVRINDRGPFVEGRIIDLSYSAAKDLHMLPAGTARVRLEILGYHSPPGAPAASSPPPGVFAVQVGAFQDRGNAERLKKQIERDYKPVDIQRFNRGDLVLYRVRVGSEPSEDAALQLAHHLRELNLATETFVVRVN
jgi:peptidoglycan lytic transglycosylase